MLRRMAAESEQLHGVARSAALTHKEKYYALRMARYPDARAKDMTSRQVELEGSTAWAIARNEAAARGSLNCHTALHLLMWRVVGVWCRLAVIFLIVIVIAYVTVDW